jgi:hypothetical protein
VRQEQLAKLRSIFVSLGGLSVDLENSKNLLNSYAAMNIKKARDFLSKEQSKVEYLLSIV